MCSTNMKLNNIHKLAEALVDNRADIDKKEEADIADRTYRADWADSLKKMKLLLIDLPEPVPEMLGI